MRLTIFEIPEDTTAWPKWLEQQLVGLELGGLVVQLETIGRSQNRKVQSLEEICGSQLPEILQHGLGSLQTQQFTALFHNPAALLELQEQVLAGGSSYWDHVDLSDEHSKAVDQVTSRVRQTVADQLNQPHSVTPATSGTAGQGTWLTGKVAAVLAALAAMVIVVFGIWSQSGRKPSGWGFDQPGLLSQDVSARKYLSNLSDAAGQWSNKRPSSAQELETRLSEFRHGCSTLIEAPHSPLKEEDRQWLVGKCKDWALEIDSFLAELKRDPSTFKDVNGRADATINRLKNALKDRALKLS